MSDVSQPVSTSSLRWFQGIPRYAWVVLLIAALGWMFDTFDQHLFTLLRVDSVKDVMRAHFEGPYRAELALRPEYAGDPKALNDAVAAALDRTAKEVGAQLTAIFLLGWAAGGFLFGIVGDRLGRTRTMMITILIYACFTGLNGLVQTPLQYAVCRFIIAMGVGGEFAAGAALVAEVWPQRSRAMALGTLQALSAVGNMAAALTVLFLSDLSWRWIFAVGALPALLVLWIRRSVKEPERWQQAREEAAHNGSRRELGNIAQLFHDPTLRRNTLAGVLLATAGVGGAWGVGFFSPDLVNAAFRPLVSQSAAILALPASEQAGAIARELKEYRSLVFLVQMIGAGLGMLGYAALSERIGRKPAMLLVFLMAFLSVQATFRFLRDPLTAYLLALQLGFFSLAPFAAYAVYFPELFPTRLRATGVGFCYNFARILAAFAPFTLGRLSALFDRPEDPTHGLRIAASIVACVYAVGVIGLLAAPETRGKPLPE
jgi:MFS family permease